MNGAYSLHFFLLGIACGIFSFYTGSLLYGLVFHGANNLVVVLIQADVLRFSLAKNRLLLLVPLAVSLALAITCLERFTRRGAKMAGRSREKRVLPDEPAD